MGDAVAATTDWRPRVRALLPLYVGAWVVALCAMLGIGSVANDDAFGKTVAAFVTVGFAVSFLLRLAGVRRSATPLLIACVGLGLATLLRLRQYGFEMPGVHSVAVTILPALLLTWFLVLYSFCLIADDLVLFVIPPSLAILGLSGTENPNADMTAYFLVFLVAAVFTVSYQNHLRYLDPGEAGLSPRRLRRLLTWQLVTTAVLVSAACVVTGVVVVPLNEAGSVGLNRFRLRASSLFPGFDAMFYGSMGREVQMGGGAPSLSDRIVFQVNAPPGIPWRSRTYDQYTGRGWVDNAGGMPMRIRQAAPGSWEANLGPVWASMVGGERYRHRVIQRFTVASPWPGRALVLAPEPAVVRFEEDPGHVQLSFAGTVHLLSTPYLQPGTHYQVVSLVLDAPPARLRRAPKPDPKDPFVQLYLRLPTSVEGLRPEAERIVAGLKSDYDRALAIERWLASRFSYNLDVPPVPRDEDVVVHFLHTAREGYCDSFASAMVVLCRLVGIPARLATGFASTGERHPDTGELVVRERDAHAWPEVFFPGYGWVAFEPTPAGPDGSLARLWKGGVAVFLRHVGRALRFPVLITVAMVLLGAHLMHLTVVQPWRRRQALLRAAGDGPRGQVLRAYYRMCERLRRVAPRRPDQTATEYSRAVASLAPGAAWASEVEVLTRVFVSARFGPGPVTQADAQVAEASLQRVLAGLQQHRNGKNGRLGGRRRR